MGEADFENVTDSREQPSADSRYTAIDVTQLNDYLFIEHAYRGISGFKDGKYLIPHQREAFYNTRRQFSDYVNFIHPIVRAMLDPVFTDKINRDYDGELTEKFVNDCNGNGMHIQSFVSIATEYVRLHSICFIVVDNVTDQPETMTEAVRQNKKPYAYIRKAYQVETYTLNMYGGLEDIMFIDKKVTIENKEVQLYRKWTPTETQLFKKKDDYAKGDEVKYVPYENAVIHGLGVLPVIALYDSDRDDPDILLPHPKMYGIAKLNHSIYNQDSERRELERNQGFAILCVQEGDGSPAGKTIGSSNYLQVPLEASNMPEFVSPEAELLAGLLEQREKKRENLFSLAEQNGVIGVTKEAKSGVALSYEFRAYESTLQKTSEIATRAETEIIELFKLWTRTNFKYEFEYPIEFQPQRELEQVTIYDTVLNYPGVPKTTIDKIMVATHKLLFPDAEQDEIDMVEKDLKDRDNPEFNNDQDGSENNLETG